MPLDTGAGGIEGPVYTPEQEEEHPSRASTSTPSAPSPRRKRVVKELRPGAPIDRRIEIGDPAAEICQRRRASSVST